MDEGANQKKESSADEKLKKLVEDAVLAHCGPKLTDQEKMQEARDSRDVFKEGRQFAEHRSEHVADEYIRLQVQIAVLLITFMGFIVGAFLNGGALDGFWMKLGACLALLFLVLSLVMGMVQLKRVEWFWDYFLRQRDLRFREWRRVAKREIPFEEAEAFERGTAMGNGNIVNSPRGWIMQTVFLALGVGILMILFVNYVFTEPTGDKAKMVQSTSLISVTK